MIDFVKIRLKETVSPSVLLNNPVLNFTEPINIETGETLTHNKRGELITPRKTAFYKNIKFVIYETGTILLSGSLHVYWNDGTHNYNDFNYFNILDVLKDLNEKFNLNPSDCILQNLEFGVNIEPPIPSKTILDNSFLHKRTPLNYAIQNQEGKYKQAEHSQYYIKLYDKALHYRSKGYKIDNEILRFEIKYTKMEFLNKNGIYSLQDFLNKGLVTLSPVLLSHWKCILFYDPTLMSNYKQRNKYNNPKYWEGLNRSNFYKQKNNYNSIVNTNSRRIKEHLSMAIEKKLNLLNN